MPTVSRLSSQLPRYLVRFYEDRELLMDVTIALPCPHAAYAAAADAVLDRLGRVPDSELHSLH